MGLVGWKRARDAFLLKKIDEIRFIKVAIVAIQKENLLKYSLEVHEVEYHNTYLATQIDNGLSYYKKVSDRSRQEKVQNNFENYSIRAEICKKKSKRRLFKDLKKCQNHSVYREWIKRSKKKKKEIFKTRSIWKDFNWS